MGSYEKQKYGFTQAFREVGTWEMSAEVEMRPSIIALDRGDLEFRIVLSLHHNDESGDEGLEGTISTPWVGGVDDAAIEAKRLRAMPLLWMHYDEEKDDYEKRVDSLPIAELVDEAVTRFKRIADPEHAMVGYAFRDAEGVRITARVTGSRVVFSHVSGWADVVVNVASWATRGSMAEVHSRIEGRIVEWPGEWKLAGDEVTFVQHVLAATAWRATG